jgi:hypothetical protein
MDVISDSPAIGLPETQPMGVELYFSNQLMPLADKLHDNLKPVGRGDAILASPVVIVPNMNLSKWIKLTLARHAGIFMNVAFQYLETGLWQMIRSIDPRPGPGPRMLDKDTLTIILFFILMAPGPGGTGSENRSDNTCACPMAGCQAIMKFAAGSLPRNCADFFRNMNITGLT